MPEDPSTRDACPELWGGIECTRNRVGNDYFDQLLIGGHETRRDDLKRLASLGVTAVRYPVLWERIAPHGAATARWSWIDDRLALLRDLGIRPIVGFVHHGSGPPDTSLVEWGFVDRLAEFGRAFAERHPWVDAFTPVNEPLTTARFSCLYGHWYPHHRHDDSFVRALLVQCTAVARTMEAVRSVRAGAQLIQTEDAGRIYGSRSLRAQVAFENHRRWLTFDLLCGRVDAVHPMWHYLRAHGATKKQLEAFVEHPCPPDVLGLNYYVTSDRMLDDRWGAYPAHLRGGNGRRVYVDTEAVRVGVRRAGSHARVLAEAWARYRRPLALTEVHLGGHRDDQVRWLTQAWRAVQRVRRRGADVRAITVWSLNGAFGWDTLVTRPPSSYESGPYDVRGAGAEHPRETALAHAVRDLATRGHVRHPVARGHGWWRRGTPGRRSRNREVAVRPVLVIGGSGTLGSAFRSACAARGIAAMAPPRAELDAANATDVAQALDRTRPWIVVNGAGFCDVDAAEVDPARCRSANVHVPLALARACALRGIPLVTFSTDLVFDGSARAPYAEGAAVAPLNAFGLAKAHAEHWVRALDPRSLIVRCGALLAVAGSRHFAATVLTYAREGGRLVLPSDVVVSATYVPALVDTVLDLAIDGETGTWHLASPDAVSWFDLGREIARRAGLETSGLVPSDAASLSWKARRPTYSVLTSARANLLPSLDACLDRFALAVDASAATPSVARRDAEACS